MFSDFNGDDNWHTVYLLCLYGYIGSKSVNRNYIGLDLIARARVCVCVYGIFRVDCRVSQTRMFSVVNLSTFHDVRYRL